MYISWGFAQACFKDRVMQLKKSGDNCPRVLLFNHPAGYNMVLSIGFQLKLNRLIKNLNGVYTGWGKVGL